MDGGHPLSGEPAGGLGHWNLARRFQRIFVDTKGGAWDCLPVASETATETRKTRDMNMRMIDMLGDSAANNVIKGAADYIMSHNLSPSDAQLRALMDDLKARCHAALDVALADAKQALDAGMSSVAIATFATTMRAAGIEGAKAMFGA